MKPSSEHDPAMSAGDYQFLREEIRHEDNLINQRISWLVSSQSFLLTGFAISLNGPVQSKLAVYGRLDAALIALIPVVGVLVCVMGFLTIVAGVLHMRCIRRLAGSFHPPHLPGVHGTTLTRILGTSGPLVIPMIFLVVWLIFIFR